MNKKIKSKTTILPVGRVADLIVFVRGHRVMVENDLARLYGVPVKQLKRQVRRNIKRFPDDFMFILTNKEQNILRRQIGTLRWGAHTKYAVFAFTEQGVAMLSGVLHSPRAIQVNIAIMRAFVQFRRFLVTHKELAKRVGLIEYKLARQNHRLGKHAEQIRIVLEALRQLINPPLKPTKQIGFVKNLE